MVCVHGLSVVHWLAWKREGKQINNLKSGQYNGDVYLRAGLTCCTSVMFLCVCEFLILKSILFYFSLLKKSNNSTLQKSSIEEHVSVCLDGNSAKWAFHPVCSFD